MDAYLIPFKGEPLERGHWGERIFTLRGLDGAEDIQDQVHPVSDPAVLETYRQFEVTRAYRYAVFENTNMQAEITKITPTTKP